MYSREIVAIKEEVIGKMNVYSFVSPAMESL